MSRGAPILVYGGTGTTGRLVARALLRRRLPFALAGRDARRLAEAARELCVEERVDFSIDDHERLLAALAGRRVLVACAGPFSRFGEPLFAACARSGLAYLDSTGEQPFVAAMLARYLATAEASRARMFPAFGFEIAPADWAAKLACDALGAAPDRLEIAYHVEEARTSPGTRRSMLEIAAQGGVYRDEGALRPERLGGEVLHVEFPSGVRACASFPGPEAILTARHTRARGVRVYLSLRGAAALGALGGMLSATVRALRPLLSAAVAALDAPGDAERRRASFAVLARAQVGDRRAACQVVGTDPYGFTAEALALGAEALLHGSGAAGGIFAPSELVLPERALAALAPVVAGLGWTVELTETVDGNGGRQRRTADGNG